MCFLARQPIFDREEKLFGYELLFRDGLDNHFHGEDVEAACRTTLDNSLLMGLDLLCARSFTFINCTQEILLHGHATLLPPHSTVVEVLESVPPERDVYNACLRLKEAGYRIALDDWVPDDPREPLADLADIIKLDLIASPRGSWQRMADCYSKRAIRMLAEKVETRADFVATRDMGFVYFQGYFFQRPVVLATNIVPTAQVNYLRMLEMATRAELDWVELEKLIKQEASICYRLLRYMNSAAFAFAREIRSVRHALSMLGEREIRKWISLVATIGAGKNKPGELVQSALIRARFCELLSSRVSGKNADDFLLGLLSLMDAILGIAMEDLLRRVPVEREIKAALLGLPSRLLPLYQLMLAQESADWERCKDLAGQLQLAESDIAQAYVNAVKWARDIALF
jgi:c-di-GMP-related signal transduction protein